MRNSSTGAPVLRKPSEGNGGGNRTTKPGAKVSPGTKPRWSGSIEDLAARKRAAKTPGGATQPAQSPAPEATPVPQASPLAPATAPFSARLRLSLFYRNWNCDRQWQIPCWLASLLLHLLAVVVLGSLTVPVCRQRTFVSLLLSFGEVATERKETPVELAASISEPMSERSEPHENGDGFLDFGTLPFKQTGEANEKPAPPDRPDQAPQTDQIAAASTPDAAPPQQAEMPQSGVSKTAILAAMNAKHDRIVDRFIEHDLGHLLGKEGVRARDDFQRLGPTAMASLVRGLNKAAKIHASCPVVVISYKVETVLRESGDPALVRYALENIGRDVPSNAPHFARLQTLIASLRSLRPEDYSPNVTMVLAQLKGGDRGQVLNAAEVVMASCDKFVAAEKREIAWGFIRLLTHRDGAVRDAAHQALVALADGADFGPANDRQPDDRFAAAGKWSMHFDEERFEAAAASVLKSAQHLQEAGKREGATRFYKRLVREYPGTMAADEAAELLEQAKVFAFK